jgi:hypothetical protein
MMDELGQRPRGKPQGPFCISEEGLTGVWQIGVWQIGVWQIGVWQTGVG